ncbi:hypothetical protein CASFOL_022787 [Castilleja foliolosa]|uniref:Uncharacterized protein n=1 Tax=Castilleja foliolosa TaxID=1961234 RepID=A0ABD3CTF8_9LAMI
MSSQWNYTGNGFLRVTCNDGLNQMRSAVKDDNNFVEPFLLKREICDLAVEARGGCGLDRQFWTIEPSILTSLPSSLGALTCLQQLHIASNKLTCIPAEIGFLKELYVLNAKSNRLFGSAYTYVSDHEHTWPPLTTLPHWSSGRRQNSNVSQTRTYLLCTLTLLPTTQYKEGSKIQNCLQLHRPVSKRTPSGQQARGRSCRRLFSDVGPDKKLKHA